MKGKWGGNYPAFGQAQMSTKKSVNGGGNMVRKMSLALALVLGTAPIGVSALGLGDIKLNSGLNQYLDADINLLSVDPDELSDIRVKLAPVEAYRRAGIERPFHLTKLRFKADAAADGSTFIHVSSHDLIREPFLNFLIEVNWPKGKLVREYTVLLDPPVTLGRRPSSVQQPTQGISRSSSAPAPSRQVSPAGPMAGAGEYGPTQKNDTLWGIATQVRHEGTNMEQTMLALQQANPQAFINNNINNLKRGQILRIPSKEEVLSLSRSEARQAYRDQLDEWQGSRAGGERMVSSPTMDSDSSTPTEEEKNAELKIASARPVGEGVGGASEGAGDTAIQEQQEKLLATEEALESAKQEGSELQARVGDLESQLEDLQRLLELKNSQLAQFQAALAEQDNAAAELAAEAGAAVEEAASEGTVAELAGADKAGADEEIVVEEATAEGSAGAVSPPEAMVEEKPEPAPAPVVEEKAEPAPVAKVEKRKPAPQPEPAPEPSFIETLMGDSTMMAAAGGGVIVLLGLLWAAMKRRESTNDDFQESILVNTIDDTDTQQVSDVQPEPVSQTTEETSFLSDFSPSDIDALQDETGEVDPLAEADVYIAYGRYQQAEELIRQAIDKNPERDGLKHKLFEILFAIKDSDGFVSLAEQSIEKGLDKKDADAWSQVISMGSQLAPESSLFSGDSTLASVSSEIDSAVDDLAELDDDDEFGLDQGLDLDEMSASVDLLDEETEAEINALELSGLHDLVDQPAETAAGPVSSDDMEFDIDLGMDTDSSFDVEETVADASPTETSIDNDDDLMTDLDIDLDMDLGDEGELDVVADDFGAGESVDGESVFTIDDPLESAGLDELDVQETIAESAEEERLMESTPDVVSDEQSAFDEASALAEELDMEGLNLEGDSAIVGMDEPVDTSDSEILSLDGLEEDTSPVEEDELPAMDLGMDDAEAVNTKLDLAKAYVEMDDADGAKSILEEVLNEGNEGQKAEAQKMLDEMS